MVLNKSLLLITALALLSRAAVATPAVGGKAGSGSGGGGDHKSHLRTVAVEAHGYAEEVHTFHELETKARGCKITGPCAWQFSFTPTDVSVIAPEPHVIYHYSLHTMFENDKTTYRIRGQYPKVRYFSVQTYTFMRQPIDGLADYEIKPSAGTNPFLEPLPNGDENGHFEVYITANGDRGYPNELKAYHADRMLTQLTHRNASWGAFLMALRYYASDPSNDQTVTWGKGPSLFGFVAPPTVEWRKDDNSPWEMLPQCTAEQEQCNTNIVDSFMSYWQFLLPLRDIPGFICPVAGKEGINSDFWLWRAHLPQILDLYIGFKNSDVTYFYWCDTTSRMGGKDFVLKIKGTVGRTPKGLYDEPVVARPEAYDARYISFHAVDLRPPIPSYSAIYDGEMWAHYGPGWDRQYSIVAAVDPAVAEACHLFDKDRDMFLPYTRQDGNMTSRTVATPGIIYREILPSVTRIGRPGQSPTDVALRCGMEDEMPDAIEGQAGAKSPSGGVGQTATTRKKKPLNPQCEDPDFTRSVMQERYPEIEVYHCDTKTGVATLLA